jgi:predicted Zn-ribbon and HTH transcriptional regulator
MACVSSAVVPSWGVRGTRPPLGGGTGRSGVPTKLRLISAPPAVLCPPARMGRYPPLSSTNNLRVWCEENGELGERILEEWDDLEKSPEDVTRGSNYRARWKCRECGRTFHAQVHARTTGSKVRGPSGCKGCLDLVATETHNLKVFCDDSGGQLDHLPGEWNHLSKRMEDFTPASAEIVPWRCGECGGEWKAAIHNRTKSEHPSGCPGCAGSVPTETNNLKLFCNESGGWLAHLPGEWKHRTKRMEDFTPASTEIVPWKCGKCGGEWDARIHNRTRSERPSGCPDCYTRGRTRKKPIQLQLASDRRPP